MPRYASRSWRSFDPARLVEARSVAAPAPASTARPGRVLGLDPGSLRTGYGIVDCNERGETHVASGCIHVKGADLARRLHLIHQRLLELVEQFRPDEVAVERVFMHRNADSALKLGQARGAALTAVVARGAAVYEYAPRAVKLALVGTGAADKAQVAHMVRALLAIAEPATHDVSDALAIALCHAQARRTAGRLAAMGSSG
ncbi:MAG TPA: crossover junction endodeoxyribonuclease RuvC [Steroidobacteraceae bacterium]|nr:crossover junction endodeoxyribonuclease RuvC [Steroidobacteraceae bacterium]